MALETEMIAAVDIGTSKVAAVIGELTETGVRVRGSGTAQTRGFGTGEVSDIDALAVSIRSALDEAELMAQQEVRSAYLTIAAKTKRGISGRGALMLPGRRVSENDVGRVIDVARGPAPGPDEVYLHTLVREFVVDGVEGIESPVGMEASQIEALVHVVRAPSRTVSNCVRALERSRLKVDGVVLEVLAASYAVLDPAEREAGVVVLEMGAGTTSLAIWYRGVLVHNATIPCAGDSITADVVVGIGCPTDVAERLKVDYGTASAARADARETAEITGRHGRRTAPVSRGFLAAIIEPRIMEILRVVRREIELSGYQDLIRAGYVLTGGTAALREVADVAQEVLDAPVRVGLPTEIEGYVDLVKQPHYAAAVGTLQYVAGGEDAGWMFPQREQTVKNRFRTALQQFLRRIL